MIYQRLGGFIVAFVVALVATPLVRRFAAKHGFVDIPDERKVHKHPVPRLGGVAIFFAFFAAAAFLLLTLRVELSEAYVRRFLGFSLGAVFLLVVGILDDIKGLRAVVKLLLQLATAGILVASGFAILKISNPFGTTINLGAFGRVMTVIWIVGIVNAINLIDGLDGLAAGVVAIIGGTMFVALARGGDVLGSSMALALSGAALGFLPYNFNPAKIFMGDSGSMFLGLALAALSIEHSQKGTVWVVLLVPLIAMAVPLLDTTMSIVRRIAAGKHVFSPDKGHIHHKMLLMDSTGSQRRVVVSLYFLTFCYSLIAIAFTDPKMRGVFGLVGVVLVVITSFMWLRRIYGESTEGEENEDQHRQDSTGV